MRSSLKFYKFLNILKFLNIEDQKMVYL